MNPVETSDEIAPLTSADYDRVAREYAEHCISLPGVSAIFQFGNVDAPGLSDIDLLVVLEDDARTDGFVLAPLSIRHERWQRNPLVRACFIHDVYVCPRSALADIDYLMPGNTWRLLAGVAEQPLRMSSEEREMIALTHSLDFCLARVRELAEVDDASPGSMRWLVPQLWSLTHTRRTLADAGVDLEGSWSNVIGALQETRSTAIWALSARDITRLLPPVREHFARAIDHLATLLSVRAGLGGAGPKRECCVALHPRHAFYLYDAVGRASARQRTIATSQARTFHFAGRTVQARWIRMDVPGLVLSHHLTYLAQDRRYERIASRIAARGRMRVGCYGSDLYRRVIAHRWAAACAADRLIVADAPALSGFGIPGLPVSRRGDSAAQGTLKFRAVRSWLDWRVIPARAIHVKVS